MAEPGRVIVGTLAVLALSVGAESPEGFQLARQGVVTEPTGTTAARARSRTIYLNRTGVTIMPGGNNSALNRSSVTTQLAAIPAWDVSEPMWRDTVQCLETMFAPFDVTFTETDPGANVPHLEAVFGGSPDLLGLPPRVGGVSPLSTSCSVIESSMVFTFTSVIPQNARVACEIQAQEIAHSFGLDHELLAADPMSYLRYQGERAFQNEMASCGETSSRPCGINGNTCRDKQNSYAILLERLGPAGAGDLEPPIVGISSPRDGATVDVGFQVMATASDDVSVTSASILIDGESAGSMTQGPWTFTTPTTLSNGRHTITIVVTDGINERTHEIAVTVRGSATDEPPDELSGVGCSAMSNNTGFLLAAAGLLELLRRSFRRTAKPRARRDMAARPAMLRRDRFSR